MKKLLLILILVSIVLISGCNKITNKGVLEGTIKIGPLCPVEKIPPDPGCQPTEETYKTYPIAVYFIGGGDPSIAIKVANLNPDTSGNFILELAPGDYMVNLKKSTGVTENIPNTNLPIQFSIKSGESK